MAHSLLPPPTMGLEVVAGSLRNPDWTHKQRAGEETQVPAWQSLSRFPSNRQRWTSARAPTVEAVSSGVSTHWAAISVAVTLGTS